MARRTPRDRGRTRWFHRDHGILRPRAGMRLRRVCARGPARLSRRGKRSRTRPGPGQGSGHWPIDARRRAPRRGDARAARVPPRREQHARVVCRARRALERRVCRIRLSCCSSTNPLWSRGAAAIRRSIASPPSTCCRARSPRSTASRACTCAVMVISGSRSRPVRKCSASKSVRDSYATRSHSAASSTATAGSHGERFPPTDRSANPPTSTGADSRRCGANSRAEVAIRFPSRARGIITPACGLAGYGASQAERVLGIARELAARVHDQAVAARLTLGA